MTRRRYWYIVFLGVAIATFIPLRLYVSQTLNDPYRNPLLSDYKKFKTAIENDDVGELKRLAGNATGYVQYQAALTLSDRADLSAAERTGYLQQVFTLRIRDAHEQAATTAVELQLALTAEQAGLLDISKEAFIEALPDDAAIEGLQRIVTEPYDLARIFYNANLYSEMFAALDGRAAPSLEAYGFRTLGNYQSALDAYDEWLELEPGNEKALLGKAWTLFNLERSEEADAIFAALSDEDARYGQALIASRLGDKEKAVEYMIQSSDPYHLWIATDWLESLQDIQGAITQYHRLADGSSTYADDAAYRIYVLETRYGIQKTSELPKSDPFNQFFRLKMGATLDVPQTTTLAVVTPEVFALADALIEAGDVQAAIGELQFSLRNTSEESTAVAIAEKLQSLGEYRQSQLAGEVFLYRGSRDLRTWKVAYPKAYPDLVQQEAVRYGVNPNLLWSVMWKESRFAPRAVSRTGAKGLMQFVPSTWKWIAELEGETPGDPYTPANSIRYGAKYLAWLINYFDGDLELVATSYNGGQGYVGRTLESEIVGGNKDNLFWQLRFEPREYLQAVMTTAAIYETLYAQP
jgi:soluble lytic murein transglycosylase